MSQYDIGCNNFFGVFPMNVCFRYDSDSYFIYSCNGTDTIKGFEYNNDCDSGDSPVLEVSYPNSNNFFGSCDYDNDELCNYLIVSRYNDGDCLGNNYNETLVITGVCISDHNHIITCDGNVVTTTTYNGNDCSGSSSSASINYDNVNNANDDICYKVSFSFFFDSIRSLIIEFFC